MESEPPRKFYTVFIVFVSQAGTKSAPGRISPLSEQKMAQRRGESKMCARRRGENVAPPPLRGWGEEQGTPSLGAGAGYNVNF